MDKARPQAASLVADLLAFIAMDGCTDEQFDALALRLFAYQYESNAPFRSFCQRRGATLRNVKTRSEEHTSELQSPCNLVCRLLLEKKTNYLMRCTNIQNPTALPVQPSTVLDPARVGALQS